MQWSNTINLQTGNSILSDVLRRAALSPWKRSEQTNFEATSLFLMLAEEAIALCMIMALGFISIEPTVSLRGWSEAIKPPSLNSRYILEKYLWLADNNHNHLSEYSDYPNAQGCQVLNFVEVMALYRAFSVGRFNCSRTSPKIGISALLSEGYVLKIAKSSANNFCLNCFRNFCNSKGLRFTEDRNYITIHSSLKDTLISWQTILLRASIFLCLSISLTS